MKQKGYIIQNFRVAKPVNDYVWHSLLENFEPQDIHLFAHILCGHIANYKNKGWTPICSKLLRKKLPKAKWKRLFDLEVIEYIPCIRKDKLSAEYRIKPSIYRRISELSPKTTDEILNSEYYNLCNGKSLNRKRPQKTIFYDSSNNKVFSELQEKAIRNIKPCKVNCYEVDKILLKRKNILDSDRCPERLRLKFDHDLRCWTGILNRKINFINDKFIIYQSAYQSQGSGRLTEIDGCYQNISRELKGAMFKDTGYKNYDLKSSQILGAKAEFESANLDTQWFDKYIKLGKNYYAEKIGVSVDCWKGILISIIFGGFPQLNKDGRLKKIKPLDLIKYKCIKNHIFPELEVELEWLAFAFLVLPFCIIQIIAQNKEWNRN